MRRTLTIRWMNARPNAHVASGALVRWISLAALVQLMILIPVSAQDAANSGDIAVRGEIFAAANSAGVTAVRTEDAIFLEVQADVQGPIQIPRLAAPLRSYGWLGGEQGTIELKPEPTYWIIDWKQRPPQANTIALHFGDRPRMLSEVGLIQSQADGSYYLAAHFAHTSGEKVRYEPQSYKNTVGYWTGKQDAASWRFEVEQAGSFNVAILQGCGSGQGGSIASISLHHDGSAEARSRLEFEVEETGHFQNFHWRHLGQIELDAAVYTLTVKPEMIANKALMDVRAVHLIRLPESRR